MILKDSKNWASIILACVVDFFDGSHLLLTLKAGYIPKTMF